MAPRGAKRAAQATPSHHKNNVKKNKKKLIPAHASTAQINIHQQTTSTYNVDTHNHYDSLSESDDNDDMLSRTSKRPRINNENNNTPRSHQYKPPPLTIPSLPQHEVIKFLAGMSTETNKYEIRHSSDGTKIFPSNNDAFNAVKTKLIANNMAFYTHLLRDEQTTKFVLHGFYATETSELKKLLNEIGIMPAKISKLSVRNKRYEDHAVYLIHFLKKDKIKIATLRESARVIEYVRVRWEFYENKSKGPIQCSRCMQYGHGGNTCNLKPLCIRCAQAHLSSECPLLIDPQTNQARSRIPDEIVKCGLCGQNHPANYSGCEKRIAFMQRQNLYRERTQRQRPQQARPQQARPQQANQPRGFAHAPQLDNSNFPSINQNAAHGSAWQSTPQAGGNPQQPQILNQELFTTAELLTIMRDMMGRLRNCTSKEQQIFAMSEICMTYLYGST